MSWRRFFRRERSDAELQAEIALHLEEEIAENVERGMDLGEARRQAYLKFGSPRRVREEVWRGNSAEWLESWWRELVYVLRRLRRAPGAVLAVVLSLGLGIAANVVVFSGVNKIVLQTPPVGQPETLMSVDSRDRYKRDNNSMDTVAFESMRRQAKSFSGVAGFTVFVQATLSGQGGPDRVWGQSATANYFDVIHIPMMLGRGFASSEEHAPVMVLGYGLWQSYFRGDSNVVGKTVSLSGKPFTIIGVARPGFHGMIQLINSDFWAPLSQQAILEAVPGRNGEQVQPVARLRPGVSRVQAQAEMDTIAQRLAVEFPVERKDLGLHIEKAGTFPAGVLVQMMALLGSVMAVALLVLCIAGSNVANLLLSRAMARHREMAVRIALGATRRQLMRPMLLESLVLSLGGGLFGVGASLLAMRALMVFHLPVDIPADLVLSVDTRVLVYAFLLSVATGLLCGLGPAFAATRPVVPSALKGESALEKPGRRWTMRNVLVVVQISACMVLLCTTGLYLHEMGKLAKEDPGFNSSGVRLLSIDPIHNGYKLEQVELLLKRIREGVTRMPGVRSAVWTDAVPLAMGTPVNDFHVSGVTEENHSQNTAVFRVDPGYFEMMGISRIAGRDFNGASVDGPKQMVVNELFAQQAIFKGRNVLGEHVSPHWPEGDQSSYEIVGVVKNSKAEQMGEQDMPIVYEELEQNVGTKWSTPPILGYALMVRYQGNGVEMATALRNEVHGIDPSLSVFNEKEMGEQVTDSLLIPRAESVVFGTFGLMGLVLAAVGLYSVMSYSVERRTREIGIRLALGATRGGVKGLVVRQGMMLSAVALFIGLPLALGASKIAAKMQYGISAYDTVSFILMPVFLLLVALIACWVPALRAARVDPQVALRHE